MVEQRLQEAYASRNTTANGRNNSIRVVSELLPLLRSSAFPLGPSRFLGRLRD